MSPKDRTTAGSLYAPPEAREGDTLFLPPDEAHHALRVKRIRPDEELIVVDGAGRWYRTVVQGGSRDQITRGLSTAARTARPGKNGRAYPPDGDAGGSLEKALPLRILETRENVGESGYRITLGQAVGKGRTFESVVEKGTELGVARFIPLSTDRVVVRPNSATVKARRQRWQRLALSAMKQCGRSRWPEVEAPRSLQELRTEFDRYDAVLLAWNPEEEMTVGEALSRAGFSHGSSPSVLALVGPEGGFTDEEVRTALAAGARAVTLGPRVLRTETAGMVMVALVGAALDPERAPEHHLLPTRS